LLGLKDQHIGLFENIAWSTHAVLEQTLANASRGSLSIELLPTLEVSTMRRAYGDSPDSSQSLLSGILHLRFC